MRPNKISVVVTTYNWPEALNRSLESAANQSWRAAEIIVADDGSRPETAELIESWRQRLPMPLIHAWQEDAGFRIARARNLAIQKATGDYFVFTDGDCVLPPTFIQDHARLAKRGWFVSGRRIMLNETATERALKGEIDLTAMSHADLRRHAKALFIKASHSRRLMRLPLGPIRRMQKLDLGRVEGCNLSIAREDLMKVRGFDESYREFGHEDVDFAIRLTRAGIKGLRAEFIAAVLHLEHPRRAFGPSSDEGLTRVRQNESYLPIESMFIDAA